MAQKLLTKSQLSESISNEVRKAQPKFDPSIPNNFIYGLIQGLALSFNNLNYKLLQTEDQAFPQTASGINLDRHGVDRDIVRFTESASSGLISIEGLSGSIIPASSLFSSGSVTLETQDELILSDNIIFSSEITRSGTTAFFESTADHGVPTGGTVIISGFDQSEYNGTFVVTAISPTFFTYEITGSPSTPGTGSGQALWSGGSVAVISQDTGSNQNLLSGATVEINSSILDVNDTAFVAISGVAGGRGIESDTDYRDRINDNNFFPGNSTAPSNINRFIKTNFSRVSWTKTKRATPAAGASETYVIHGNEASIIPTSDDLNEIKDKCVEEILPAANHEDNFYILAPTPVNVSFELTAVVPNTSKMQVAIQNNLKAFFLDNIYFEETLTETAYRNAIQNTVDEDGESIKSFVLLSPSGDQIANTGEILSLGSVTFS